MGKKRCLCQNGSRQKNLEEIPAVGMKLLYGGAAMIEHPAEYEGMSSSELS